MLRWFKLVAVVLTLFGGVLVAAQVQLNTFQEGTLIRAEDVNENFEALRDALQAMVASVNGKSGNLTIAAGDNVSIDDSAADTITIHAVPQATSGSSVVHSGGWNAPELVTQREFAEFQIEFQTDRPGRLLMTMSGGAELHCDSEFSYRWYFLLLDGEPVPSSTQIRSSLSADYALAGALTGFSETVVQPGMHTLGIGGMCGSGSAGGTGIALRGTANILMLP